MVSGIEGFGNDEISNNTARPVTNSFYACDLSRSLVIQLVSPFVVQRISRMQDLIRRVHSHFQIFIFHKYRISVGTFERSFENFNHMLKFQFAAHCPQFSI
jgi:hypothetical protein